MGLVIINSFLISVILTPLLRKIAIAFDIIDQPATAVKTHQEPVPYLGGAAIMLGMTVSMAIYFVMQGSALAIYWEFLFTLFSLFVLGTLDDMYAFSARFRFLVQSIIFFFFISATDSIVAVSGNALFDQVFTLFWLLGVTNAFNIIDIMDGLCAGVSIIVSLFLTALSIFSGSTFALVLALATAGSALGFIGYNFSRKLKIFMGDGGSTLLGATLGIAAILFCENTASPALSFLSIVVLFGIPLYDTILVMILRIRKGISPFIGSRDHFALRMVAMGFSRVSTVISTYIVTLALGLVALVMYFSTPVQALALLAAVSLFGITWGRMLSIIDVSGSKK